jgi:hypothetical protein
VDAAAPAANATICDADVFVVIDHVPPYVDDPLADRAYALYTDWFVELPEPMVRPVGAAVAVPVENPIMPTTKFPAAGALARAGPAGVADEALDEPTAALLTVPFVPRKMSTQIALAVDDAYGVNEIVSVATMATVTYL